MTSQAYNVSFNELQKLFELRGHTLFSENVRIGVDGRNGKVLKEKFKTIIVSSFLSIIDEAEKKEILEHDFFSAYKNVVLTESVESFVFHHNGITVILKCNPEFPSTDTVKFKSSKASVINGAQTLSKLDSIFRELEEIVEELNPELVKSVTDLKTKLFIRTTFLWSKEGEFKKQMYVQITEGLNSQIAINYETILANSDIIERLNKKLKNRIKIKREGELGTTYILSVHDFVKKYLVFNQQPGLSRNLPKTKLEGILTEAETKFEDISVVEDFRDFLTFEKTLDNFLKEKTKEKNDDIGDQIIKNGKFYFKSYLKPQINNYLDIEDATSALRKDFLTFEETIRKYENIYKIDSNVFKSDKLWDKISSIRQRNSTDIKISEIKESVRESILEKLKNPDSTEKSSSHRIVDTELKNSGINIKFRTLTLDENSRPKEHFSLPSRTFSNIIDVFLDDEGKLIYDENKRPQFSESTLYKELEKEINFAIIQENDLRFKTTSLIALLDLKKCEDVFNQTLDAFEKAEFSELPKSSQKQGLHVRPKAQDAEDTFTFTDGEQKTRQTFWVDREVFQAWVTSTQFDNE